MTLISSLLYKDLVRRTLRLLAMVLLSLVLVSLFAALGRYSGDGFAISVILMLVAAKLPKLFAMACILAYFLAVCGWRRELILQQRVVALATFNYSIYREILIVIIIGSGLAILSYAGQSVLAPMFEHHAEQMIKQNAGHLWQQRLNQGGWVTGASQEVTIWSPGEGGDSKLPYVIISLPGTSSDSDTIEVVAAKKLVLEPKKQTPTWFGLDIDFFTLGKDDSQISQAHAASARGGLALPKNTSVNYEYHYDRLSWNLALALVPLVLGLVGVGVYCGWQRRKSEVKIVVAASLLFCVYLGLLIHARNLPTAQSVYWMVHGSYFFGIWGYIRYQNGRV